MNKAEIIDAIKQIADRNGGIAPGSQTFQTQTGIKKGDWYPHLWLRWGDALIEAGYEPNEFQSAIAEDVLIQKYITLTRSLKHFPVEGELRRQAKSDSEFPSHTVFRRFGGKEKLIQVLLRYCRENPGHDDITQLCEEWKDNQKAPSALDASATNNRVTGFVYLMKSGRHYKIGHTISPGSRERQLAISIPIPPTTIHTIKTDDPCGIEAYWHKRFAAKRGEGEWFDLSPEDVAAFKRWKKIV